MNISWKLSKSPWQNDVHCFWRICLTVCQPPAKTSSEVRRLRKIILFIEGYLWQQPVWDQNALYLIRCCCEQGVRFFWSVGQGLLPAGFKALGNWSLVYVPRWQPSCILHLFSINKRSNTGLSHKIGFSSQIILVSLEGLSVVWSFSLIGVFEPFIPSLIVVEHTTRSKSL